MRDSNTWRERQAGAELSLAWLVPLVLFASSACSSGEPLQRFPFVFHATLEGRSPIGGVQFSLRDPTSGKAVPIGQTGPDGNSPVVAVRGKEGAHLPLVVQCPQGYRVSEAQKDLVLRRIQDLGEEGRTHTEVSVECAPTKRVAVVAVLTNEEQIPVRIDGRPFASTDESGTAHFVQVVRPGSRFQVELDTSHDPDLMPRSPFHWVEVEDDDDVTVITQVFEKPKAKPRAKPRPKPRPRPRPRPRPAPDPGPHIPRKIF